MFERRLMKRADLHRIEVIMQDDTCHQVTPRVLDVLLENNRVTKFRRSSGWVTVGIDPVRVRGNSGGHPSYSGPERRVAY